MEFFFETSQWLKVLTFLLNTPSQMFDKALNTHLWLLFEKFEDTNKIDLSRSVNLLILKLKHYHILCLAMGV